MNKYLVKSGQDWTFKMLEDLQELGANYMTELGFTYYPLQIEIVSPEQMLGLYASHAMPINYNHWSIGESFVEDSRDFFAGKKGLAFEICKNTNPCLCYNMETNNATEQASVIFHVYGHSSHFASNYLYKNNAQADLLVPYMDYVRKFLAQCEYKYSVAAVEHILDLALSLQYHSMNRYKRSKVDENKRNLERELHRVSTRDFILDKLHPRKNAEAVYRDADNETGKTINLPEENFLYFIEKHSPSLTKWQREICRIIRTLAQFSYQNINGQSQIMAEGTAMFVECYIMRRAHDDGYIDEGAYLEYLKMNSAVLNQYQVNRRVKDPFTAILQTRLNPYFLGLEMMRDIRRMCEQPTASDMEFNSDICGSDWKKTLSDAISNYKDESFIRQFLSPHLIKKLQLMHVESNARTPSKLLVKSHAEHCDDIREALAEINTIDNYIPNVQIESYEDDDMQLIYKPVHGRRLHNDMAHMVMCNVSELMGGCAVYIKELDDEDKEIL